MVVQSSTLLRFDCAEVLDQIAEQATTANRLQKSVPTQRVIAVPLVQCGDQIAPESRPDAVRRRALAPGASTGSAFSVRPRAGRGQREEQQRARPSEHGRQLRYLLHPMPVPL